MSDPPPLDDPWPPKGEGIPRFFERFVAPRLPKILAWLERQYAPFWAQYAEDAVLSAYILALTKAKKDGLRGSQSDYLNAFPGKCRNELRKEMLKLQPRMREGSVDIHSLHSRHALPEDVLVEKEERLRAQQALNFEWLVEEAQLSEDEATLILTMYGKLAATQKEAAEILDMDPSTVSRRHASALEKLVRRLQQ